MVVKKFNHRNRSTTFAQTDEEHTKMKQVCNALGIPQVQLFNDLIQNVHNELVAVGDIK